MIPFGDAAALARELRRGDVAAFIAEPIQGKGVNLAPDEFWQEAQSLCRRHKALMVLDEVQAGLGRSGTFFCHEQFGITPDIITVSKALSGGFVPVGAMLSTAAVSDAVYSSMDRAVVHSSTFSTNQLAMVAGLATLAAFDDEDILDRVQRTGKAFTKALQPLVEQYEFLHEVRGKGLMIGLVLRRAVDARAAPPLQDGRGDPARLVLPNGGDAALPPPPHPHAGGGRQHERHQAPAAFDRRGRRGRALRRRARRRAGQRPAGVEPDLRVRQDHGQGHVAPDPAVKLASGDRVLVTGASGFIGSAVTRQLLAREQEVIALVEPGADTTNLEGLDVKQVIGDLRSRDSVQSAVSGCRAVFHVAALYRFWARDPDAFYAINVDGTRNVLGAAEEAGVERLVYTSTVGTLGLEHVSGSRSADERSFPDVRHLYGSYKRSKYVAEHEVLRAIAEGLPASLVLPTFPVGPGDRAPTPTGKLVLDFLNGRMPAFVDTVLNVAHVDDLAAGQVLVLEKGRTGRSYILGGENMTLEQVLAQLAVLTGLPAPYGKVPNSLALAVAAVSELVEGRLLRRHPSVPLEAARMSTSRMSFDIHPGPRGTGVCAAARRRGARGFGPLVRRNGHGPREQGEPDPLVLRPLSATAVPSHFGHTGRRGSPVHLHHARALALLPARSRGAQGHQPLVLSGSEDRRHRLQRIGKIVTAADHGRRGRRVLG